MKRIFSALLGLLTTFMVANAQADHKLDPQTLSNDSIILKQVIYPAIQQPQEPDWKVLRTTIVTRYNDTYADRNVTKAKIYYFYSKDWTQFCSALVQYTQNYEYKDDLALMNKNAKMVLSHSQNPADWKAAQGWVKYACEKAPSNEAYKATYDALTAKIGGQ